jgi:hypothetical protein
MPYVALLGPQRHHPTLADTFRRVGASGPVAAITAGWEEREDEIDELTEHLGCEVVNLRLHGRTEHIFQRDGDFLAGWQARRVRIRTARNLYRSRLHYAMQAVRSLAARASTEPVVTEIADAIETVRDLDTRHVETADAIHAEFLERWHPTECKSVALQRKRVAELIGDCDSIAFAGGHVAVLRNRLRLFGIADLIGERPIVAWSAGAMCMTDRVIAFHDNTPQGRRDPAVLDRGLGLCPDVVALPHAAERLSLDDSRRVSLLARRLAPRTGVALDDASGLLWDGERYELLGAGARRLRIDGSVTDMQTFEEPAPKETEQC